MPKQKMPAREENCSQKGCYHPFRNHYETYDGQATGCAWVGCACPGFAVVRLYHNPIETEYVNTMERD